MHKLMGYLAQFASFSKQGELLCTQSLAYLLLNTEARHIFATFLSNALGGITINDSLSWRAEYRQSDGCRPDLEGCIINNIPVVKIEGKLDAQFGKKQLSSYLNELCKQDFPCCLIILVPHYRLKEAIEYTANLFTLQEEGPWQIENVSIAVITWENLLQSLEGLTGQDFLEDLSQLRALYRSLNGDDMEPLTTDEQVLLWRERQGWWEKLVDVTTRRLTPEEQTRLLPLDSENATTPYFRRYVCSSIPGIESCYSIGTRDPFQNFRTPIWLRFHKGTGHFKTIMYRLEHSSFEPRVRRSGGHIWYPLEVPKNADREVMINSLIKQVEQILAVAYQSSKSG